MTWNQVWLLFHLLDKWGTSRLPLIKREEFLIKLWMQSPNLPHHKAPKVSVILTLLTLLTFDSAKWTREHRPTDEQFPARSCRKGPWGENFRRLFTENSEKFRGHSFAETDVGRSFIKLSRTFGHFDDYDSSDMRQETITRKCKRNFFVVDSIELRRGKWWRVQVTSRDVGAGMSGFGDMFGGNSGDSLPFRLSTTTIQHFRRIFREISWKIHSWQEVLREVLEAATPSAIYCPKN